MIWYIAQAVVLLFAGIGVKWAVDRLFGREIQMIVPPRHAAPDDRPPAAKTLEFDDTMDVLAAGVDAGKRTAAARPVSAAEPAAGGTWEPRRELVLPGPGGWNSGPCLDIPQPMTAEYAGTEQAEYAKGQQPAGGGA